MSHTPTEVGEQMVEDEEEMITLPKEMAEMLLADSLKLQANQTSIVEKMSETLSQLTRFIEHSNGSLNEKLDTLNENVTILNGTLKDASVVFDTKLERLIKILEKGSDVTTQAAQPFDSEKTIKRRNQLVEKIVRSEILSVYYDELISDATPFAPHKWRTTVPKNTPERDLKHRRQETINKVRTEIAIMQDRITDWRSQITEVDQQIEDFTSDNETLKLDIVTHTRAHEQQYRAQFQQKNLAKLKEEYEQDKLINFDCLITIAEEEANNVDDSAKNFRDQKTKRKKGRGGRM